MSRRRRLIRNGLSFMVEPDVKSLLFETSTKQQQTHAKNGEISFIWCGEYIKMYIDACTRFSRQSQHLFSFLFSFLEYMEVRLLSPHRNRDGHVARTSPAARSPSYSNVPDEAERVRWTVKKKYSRASVIVGRAGAIEIQILVYFWFCNPTSKNLSRKINTLSFQ